MQDYLCNRLYGLPENGVEQYLLQLVQLVLTRPHSSLERVLVDLCARSLRLAVKVRGAARARETDATASSKQWSSGVGPSLTNFIFVPAVKAPAPRQCHLRVLSACKEPSARAVFSSAAVSLR